MSMRQDLARKVSMDLPVWAECGGLMYLVQRLRPFEGESHDMVGILPGRAVMGKQLRALGYYEAELLRSTWLGRRGDRALGHTFHYSKLNGLPRSYAYAFALRKPADSERDDSAVGLYDGLTCHNVVASYLHIHFASKTTWVKGFLRACRVHEQRSQSRP